MGDDDAAPEQVAGAAFGRSGADCNRRRRPLRDCFDQFLCHFCWFYFVLLKNMKKISYSYLRGRQRAGNSSGIPRVHGQRSEKIARLCRTSIAERLTVAAGRALCDGPAVDDEPHCLCTRINPRSALCRKRRGRAAVRWTFVAPALDATDTVLNRPLIWLARMYRRENQPPHNGDAAYISDGRRAPAIIGTARYDGRTIQSGNRKWALCNKGSIVRRGRRPGARGPELVFV
ncbi:hypothetical protein EVAR_45520_1 [Eumeta japonica]|uniref:Uncharacterized protein n=1 Tax=Eumeta variegata TaxID=151549 RepID=A0A4C1X8H1_EUMVA|nr:hypothetical protein EVAR_45520_1 [Eumeta japonica]